MTEDLKVLYKGKATQIKGKSFLSTESYVKPFIDRLDTYKAKYLCQAKMAEQLSYDNTTIDTVYNKVLITAVLPSEYDFTVSYTEPNLFSLQNTTYVYHRVICMAYALDVKTPVCKFYSGVVDKDLNFYAFGKDCFSIQEIEPDTPINFTYLSAIINNINTDLCKNMLSQFKSIIYKTAELKNTLGDWVDFTLTKEYSTDLGKVKLSSAMAIEAYKQLNLDKNSDLYSEAANRNLHSLYKAWSKQIAEDDKDLINRYEKTQLVNRLFKL